MLHVENVQKRFKKHTVLAGISFELGDDEFAVLYGLPGSGKSVLLRTIMGLERPDGGTVKIRDGDAATMLPGERNIGYVPQSFALFPDKSVRENIGYPLTCTDTPRDEITDAVDSVAKMLQIQDHLEKLPSQLSGGQKQRVAIARGLVKKNEPLLPRRPSGRSGFQTSGATRGRSSRSSGKASCHVSVCHLGSDGSAQSGQPHPGRP